VVPGNRDDLKQVPGQYLVDAMDRLPPCKADSTAQDLEIEVPLAGRFIVTFEPRRQVIRGQPTRWIWIPTLAERD